MTDRLVVGAAIGQCVHVAGLEHFLGLAVKHGWTTASLGPAVPITALLGAAAERRPDLVAVSYRLTADDLQPLLEALQAGARGLREPQPRWVFGGTPPAAEVARRFPLFSAVFDGTESPGTVDAFLTGRPRDDAAEVPPGDLLGRIQASFPVPLLRHHYGEPDVERTIAGARRIAEARVLDILSIGPDQNAQQHFFRPEEMDPRQHGAGGVPLRRPEDLRRIFEASRVGNHPLVRCYSGTRDLVRWAEMSLDTIRIAWGAIPLCWYSELDGRSRLALPDAIREKQAAIRWYAEHGVPVEVNEPHQWALREGHDTLFVATSFLAAYNARALGVRHYVHQMMHNTPPSTSPAMDLAKMLASLELIAELEGPDFTVFREVRAGIASLPADPDEAKGHMAASAVYSMALKPHILHVVGFSEATRVVDPGTLIESCRIARGAVRLALQGAADPATDARVQARRRALAGSARTLLQGLRVFGRGSPDPWTDPGVLAGAIGRGILDAPHFRGNPNLCGRIVTACVDGGWEVVDATTGRPIGENERLRNLGVEV